MTIRIPAPHAIEGYAPRVNQYGGYSTPRSSWVGTPLQQASPQLQTQPANRGDGKRHKPDQKITEEEKKLVKEGRLRWWRVRSILRSGGRRRSRD